MDMRLQTMLLVFCQVFILNVCAATLRSEFDTFDTEDGLSQSTVHCVLQDSRGYLWVGTDDGLNRYDGTQFVQFHSDPEDSTTLSNSGVWSIFEDRTGSIWVGTQKAGLNRFDRRAGRFEQVLTDAVKELLHGDAIVCISQDQIGNVWAGTTKSGLIRVDNMSGTVQVINSQTGDLPTDRIRCLVIDGSKHLLIGTSNKGLIRLDVTDATWSYMAMGDTTAKVPFSNVQNLAMDPAGNLWLATLDAGVQFCRRKPLGMDRFAEVRNVPGLDITRIRSVTLDPRNTLWIATSSEGLVEYRIDTQNLVFHKHDRTKETTLADDNLLCLELDRSEDLWVGTWSSGLCRLRLRSTPFQAITMISESDSGNASFPVLALHESDSATVLVGTVGHGLLIKDISAQLHPICTPSSMPVDFSSVTVTSFVETTSDSVLVGTYNEGLYLYDRRTDILTQVDLPFSVDSLHLLSILCLAVDEAHNLWLGTVNYGAIRISSDQSVATYYRESLEPERRISDNIVYALHADRTGNMWIGTLDGLVCVTRDGNVKQSFNYDRINRNTLSNGEIRAIADDSHGNVWVGTSNGVNRISADFRAITRYTESSGLVNGVIYGLLIDDHDDVWVSTNSGISVVRTSSGQIENYFSWDGLPSGEFNQGAYTRLQNGNFLFGGSLAVTRFTPDSVRARQVPVVINDVRDYQSNEYLTRDPSPTEVLVLPHTRKHLAIDFSAIEFYGGVQRGYAYRMIGVADDWIRNVASSSAVFTNLKPGKYVFEVRREGAEQPETTALEIVIEFPWWSRPEAVLCWLAIGAGLLFYAFYAVQRRAAKRAVLQRERELQLFINRRYLLDTLSIIGHNVTTRDCFDSIIRNCRRLRDPQDMSAADKLRKLASEYLTHTSQKIDDLPVQVPLAEIPVQYADPFLAEAKRMDQLIRSVKDDSDVALLRNSASTLADSVEAFLSQFKLLIGHLSQIYNTDVTEAIRFVVSCKKDTCGQSGVTVDIECKKNYVCFFKSPDFVAMFDDLISNALEAMRHAEVKHIGIRVVEVGDEIEIYLSDSGCGIKLPRRDWSSVFESRYTTKLDGKGGLGLYNANQMMLRYQGVIKIHESSPETGTTFRLKLKLASI